VLLLTWLSEDCTYLAGGLVLLGAVFLVALQATQEGKYLVWGIIALGLGLGVVLVEWLWVTDAERIEHVVYDLRQAVSSSNVDGVLAQLAPEVQYSQAGVPMPPEATRSFIRASLSHSQFDFIRISQLQTSVAEQARRGKAEFRVLAKGALNVSGSTQSTGTARSSWSLGFREVQPGVWKVCRITPLSVPSEMLALPEAPAAPSQSSLGFLKRDHQP
jgi:hypothetical protein